LPQWFARNVLQVCDRLVSRSGRYRDTFDVAVRCFEATDIHPEAAGDRRTHLVDVQLLALDFAAFHHVLSECFQDGFLLKLEAQRFHVTNGTWANRRAQQSDSMANAADIPQLGP